MRTEVRFAGIGGQGSVLASTILAEAAGMAGREAVQTQFYEAAIRGGAAAGDTVIGDEPVSFPWVLNPDYLIAQHQGAMRAHFETVKPDAIVIADTMYVTEIPETTATVYHVPLTEIADGVGIRRVANMVGLATFVKASGIVEFEQLERAVLARSPFGSGPTNQQAIREGFDLDLEQHRVTAAVGAGA